MYLGPGGRARDAARARYAIRRDRRLWVGGRRYIHSASREAARRDWIPWEGGRRQRQRHTVSAPGTESE